MTSYQHDLQAVRNCLASLDNGSLRGDVRRSIILKARAAFDRLTLGVGTDAQSGPVGQGMAALIPEWRDVERVHIGRGCMDEVRQ